MCSSFFRSRNLTPMSTIRMACSRPKLSSLMPCIYRLRSGKLSSNARVKSAIVPRQTTAITSGCAPVRDLLNEGHTVGLGTDVSGGFHPSILENVRQAVWVSRHLRATNRRHSKVIHRGRLVSRHSGRRRCRRARRPSGRLSTSAKRGMRR